MYLKKLVISGFRPFNNEVEIHLNKGLNLLVGENASGKSSIVDAIRFLLNEDEYVKNGIRDEDFNNSSEEKNIFIKGIFSELTEMEKVKYLSWLNNDMEAILNIEISKELDGRKNYKKRIWSSESKSTAFEWELLNDIQCVYLPALRDVEKRMQSYRGSRLSRLILNLTEKERKNKKEQGLKMDLENDLNQFNSTLINHIEISKAQTLINDSLKDCVGNTFGQTTKIQFNNVSYEKIIDTLKLMFYPKTEAGNVDFLDLLENSLGYNNLIYISTILAEFEGLKDEYSSPRILLIEEIEAHIHPQLQLKIMKFLQKQAEQNDIQLIVTTHSPILASTVDINNIISLNIKQNRDIKITSLFDCNLFEEDRKFINRWLDATKSTMLFSKGNIFVEGLAESMLIPKFAEVYMETLGEGFTKTLEEAGISVINMNGIFFDKFIKLYCGYKPNQILKSEDESKKDYKQREKNFLEKSNYDETEYEKVDKIDIKCAILTDNDPDKKTLPTNEDDIKGKNPKLYLKDQLNSMCDNCKVFTNLKTLEYDLAIANKNNCLLMINILQEFIDTDGTILTQVNEYIEKLNGTNVTEKELSEIANWIVTFLDKNSFSIGKGLFAQILADKISIDFVIPEYIKQALNFVLDITVPEEKE